jgi:O-antigen ligase
MYTGGFFGILGIGFFLISFIFFKRLEILYLLIFLIPNQRLLVLEGSSISILNFGFIYLFLTLFITSSKPKLSNNLKGIILFLLFYSTFLLVLRNSFVELILIIKFIIIMVVLIIEFEKAKSKKVNDAILSFVYGVFTFVILSLLFKSSEQTGRFDTEFNEPNYIGTICSFGLSLFLVISQRIHFNKIFIFFITISISVLGLITQSRAFLLSITIIAVFFLVLKFKRKFIVTLGAIIISIIFFASSFMRFYYNSNTLQALTSRVINPKNGDISGGRSGLWDVYYDILTTNSESLFFGVGNNAMEIFNLEQVAHNAILEDLLTFGLLGTAVVYWFLVLVFRKMIIKNNSIVAVLPLFIFLLNSMTLHSFLGMGGLVQLFIGVIIIKFYNYKVS